MLRSRTSRSRRSSSPFLAALLAAPLLVAACDTDDDDHADDGHSHEHGTTVDPSEDPRVDEVEVGLTKEGDAVSISLLGATPSEPIRGDNAWTLRVTDAAGAPLEDFTVAVQPWMPDHGHGTTQAAEITYRDAGEVHFDPLHLYMAGLWELRFTITPAEGDAETLVIGVWIP